ncbi:hypothetical protein JZU46_00985 [bacterium]|nr:hypothetical protein [bacterium]
MCGIVGVFAFKEVNEDKKQAKKREAMLYFFTELLQVTQTRGKDATGASVLFNDGHFLVQKGGVPANDFIGGFGEEKHNYRTFLTDCRKYKEPIKLLVGHCRKSSVGTNFNNNNNHPVRAGEIIGVHNGTLTNHEKIFKKLNCKRDGTVDSEAIMRLLEFYTNDCKDPFTIETLTEVACRLDGAYSVIAYNANNPFQVALMKRQRPMEIYLIKPLQLMVVVSEKAFMEDVVFNFNKGSILYNNGFDVIKPGDIEVATFPLDNVGVVDLTQTITAETKIDSLIEKYDTFKEPKFWQTYTPVTNYGHGYNNHVNTTRQSFADKGTSKKNDTTPGTSAGKGANLSIVPKENGVGVHGIKTAKKGDGNKCRIWNKDLNRYADPVKVDKLANINALLLSNNSDVVTVLDKNDNVQDTVVMAETTNLFIKERQDAVPINVDEEKTPEVSEPLTAVMVVDKIENEVSTDVLKAAKAAADGAIRFSNEQEVVDYLNATSVSNLKVIPLNALANRLGHSLYEKAFLEGAQFYSELCNINTNSSKPSEKIIRITKHVIRLFGNVLSRVCMHKDVYTTTMGKLMLDLKLEELTRPNMLEVFSKGDLVNNPGLIALVQVINSKNNGKENNLDTISKDGQQ